MMTSWTSKTRRLDSPSLAGCWGEPSEDENLKQVGHPLRELLDVARVVAKGHNWSWKIMAVDEKS